MYWKNAISKKFMLHYACDKGKQLHCKVKVFSHLESEFCHSVFCLKRKIERKLFPINVLLLTSTILQNCKPLLKVRPNLSFSHSQETGVQPKNNSLSTRTPNSIVSITFNELFTESGHEGTKINFTPLSSLSMG